MTPFKLPKVIGHRGAAAHAPENSLAGLAKAAELGASWIEFDVMLTGDGVPVLFHDDSFERLLGIEGLMAETPFGALRDFDLGAAFAPAFTGERIPTLETALSLMLDLGRHPLIEIKPTAGRDVETAIKAIEVAQRLWPKDLPPPLISSFSRMSLAAVAAQAPHWPRALNAFEAPSDWALALRALGCSAFHLGDRGQSAEIAAEIKASGYQLAAFTINDAARVRELAAWPVDCMISDAPEMVLATLAAADS